MAVELRRAPTIQTELGSAKLRTLDDCHLLAQPLFDLKHWTLDASSTHSAEESRVSAITEQQWRSFSIALEPAD